MEEKGIALDRIKMLIENIATGFQPPRIDLNELKTAQGIVSDSAYYSYITSISNGGFYFHGSLQLYGFAKDINYHNIFEVNDVFRREYQNIAYGKFVFGQDIFANQFAFTANGIFVLNAETGDCDFMARDFADWLGLLSEDTEYLTGMNLLRTWELAQSKLHWNQRLCAKKPFVIGGGFSIENLYPQIFPAYIESNANIARQIYGKPDGTEVKITIIE